MRLQDMLKCTHVQGEKGRVHNGKFYRRTDRPAFRQPECAMGIKNRSPVHPGVQAPGMGAKAARETDERHLPRQWHRPGYSGRKRIENFSVRLDDAVREGRFLPDRRIYNSRPAGAADPEQMPLEERVRWLIHELEYAKQEVEFLKKLQMANTEARKEWESKHRHG